MIGDAHNCSSLLLEHIMIGGGKMRLEFDRPVSLIGDAPRVKRGGYIWILSSGSGFGRPSDRKSVHRVI